MKEFDHIGIITAEPQEGESWVEFSKVWVTNPRLHANRIEYIRPLEFPEIDPTDLAQWKLWHLPHVAYRVDNLQEAIAGEEWAAEALDARGPDFGDAGKVAFQGRRAAMQLHTQAAVHGADIARLGKPRMHFGRHRARIGARRPVRGPHMRVGLGDVCDDGQ